VWLDEKGEALKALAPLLADSKRPKIVHDPKIFQLLTGRAANIQHATQLYSYLLRPDGRQSQFCGRRDAAIQLDDGRRPANARIICSGSRLLSTRSQERNSKRLREKLICRCAQVLADIERAGIRVNPKELDKCRSRWRRKSGGWKRRSGSSRARNSTSIRRRSCGNSLRQTESSVRTRAAGKPKRASTAVDVLEGFRTASAARENHRVPGNRQLKSTYVDALRS